jgi:hypothetical protein
MRSTILVRCGIASLLIGGGMGGMFAAGCGSDDNGNNGGGGNDSGSDSNQVGDDGPTTTDDGGTTTHPDAGDGATEAEAAAADTTMDLAGYNITVYAIPAAELTGQTSATGASELTCKQLVGSAALAADAGGLDPATVFNIGTIPANTLKDQTTTLALVTGCLPGITDSNDALVDCPAGYSAATGDLALTTATLDTTTALDGGALGAQFFYASHPFSYELGGAAGTPVAAGFTVNRVVVAEAGAGDDGGDAGDAGTDAGDAAVDAGPVLVPVTQFIPIAAPVTNGEFAPSTLALVPGLTFDGTTAFTAAALGADGGTTGLGVSLPLPTIQALSYPGASTAEFANGVGYVFVLVGDPNPALPAFIGPDGGPSAPDAGVFNTQVAHFLAFPVNPPFGN